MQASLADLVPMHGAVLACSVRLPIDGRRCEICSTALVHLRSGGCVYAWVGRCLEFGKNEFKQGVGVCGQDVLVLLLLVFICMQPAVLMNFHASIDGEKSSKGS